MPVTSLKTRPCGLPVCGAARRGPRHWSEKARNVDAFDAKADLMAALDVAGAPVANVQVVQGAPAWFHPGRSGTVQLGPKNQLGWFGEVHPARAWCHGC